MIKRRGMKRFTAVFLAMLMSVSQVPAFLTTADATATAIPVSVDLSKFDSTLVNSSTTGTSLIQTTGSAGVSSNHLLLTSATTTQAGTAVRRNRMLLGSSGFSTYFQMHITGSTGAGDGLCFIVYQADSDTKQTGATGEGLGYLNISNSIGVEFDTYYNSNRGDPNAYHVAIDSDGAVTHSSSTSTTSAGDGSAYTPTDDGTSNIAHNYSSMLNNDISVWADYDGSDGYLTITYGTSTDRASSSNYSFKRKVGTTLVGKNVFVGFSASTGSAVEKNEIYKWYFSNNYVSGGLASADGSYSQAASTASIAFDGTGTGNATYPTKASVSLNDTSGAAMSNQSFKIAVDGTDTGTTYDTGSSGTYDYTLPSSLTVGSHSLTVTSTDGSVVKTASFVAAPATPSITSGPSSATVTAGDTVGLSVAATRSDTGTLSYQWQKSTDSGASYADISGATSSTYTTPVLKAADTGVKYRCVVTNTLSGYAASANSSAATVTVDKMSPGVSAPLVTPPTSQIYLGSLSISATLSNYYGTLSGQTITFKNGSAVIGTAITNSTGTATLTTSTLGAGNYSITASFSGDSNNNSAESTSTSYSISKATQASLTADSSLSKTYGDSATTLSVSGGSGTGQIGYSSSDTDVVTVSSSGVVTIVGAGSAIITVTKAADSNYNEISTTVPVTISKKSLNPTIIPAGKTYDASAAAAISSISYGGRISGQTDSDVAIAGTVLQFADKTAGIGKAVLASGYSLTGSKASDYQIGTVTVNTASVAKLSVSVQNLSVKNKVYDGSVAAEFVSTPSLNGVISGDVVDLNVGTASFAGKDYSGSAITVSYSGFSISGTDAANYSLSSLGTTTAEIGQRELYVTVSPVTIKSGQSIPDLTVNVTGFATGENASNLSGFSMPTATPSYGSTITPVTDAMLAVNYSAGNPTANYKFSYNTESTITVAKVIAGNTDYEITPAESSGIWHKEDIVIRPTISGGYDLVSLDGINWYPEITLSSETADGNVAVYLKKSSDGTQTDGFAYSYSLDKTKPSALTVEVGEDSFHEFLNTISFGLFFKDTVSVEISATDDMSGIDHYEYQLVDTSKGESYDVNGTWINSTDGTFSIDPQFKGVVYARAVDNAGNVTDVIQTDGFAVDSQSVSSVNITAAAGGSEYNGAWTSDDVKISVGATAGISGIKYYEYRIGLTGEWKKMPAESGAEDSTSGNAIADTLTITNDMNDDIYIRAVSNAGVAGNASAITVKRDSVEPELTVGVSGTTGKWTDKPVTFIFSNSAGNLSDVTYWVKEIDGNWVKIGGNTFTPSGTVDTSYQFKAVSASGEESQVSDSYTVKYASDLLKDVINNIDSLPNPDTASENDILSNEQKIKDTKVLYDMLSSSEKDGVGTDRTQKLNSLIERLNALLQVIPKDTATGIFAENIGTSVQLDELNDPNVGKVTLQVIADRIADTGTSQKNIAIAGKSLSSDGREILASYDVGIFKTVYDVEGAQLSYGKVDNSKITAPIRIYIPVPEGYEDRSDLQATYIDDAGNVTDLDTTLVVVDYKEYLSYETNHFSVYAVTADVEDTSSVAETPASTGNTAAGSLPKTGDSTPIAGYALIFVISGTILFVSTRRKKSYR